MSSFLSVKRFFYRLNDQADQREASASNLELAGNRSNSKRDGTIVKALKLTFVQ
jgi:hypothetical protein